MVVTAILNIIMILVLCYHIDAVFRVLLLFCSIMLQVLLLV